MARGARAAAAAAALLAARGGLANGATEGRVEDTTPAPPAPRWDCGSDGTCVQSITHGHASQASCQKTCTSPPAGMTYTCGGLGKCFQNKTSAMSLQQCEAGCKGPSPPSPPSPAGPRWACGSAGACIQASIGHSTKATCTPSCHAPPDGMRFTCGGYGSCYQKKDGASTSPQQCEQQCGTGPTPPTPPPTQTYVCNPVGGGVCEPQAGGYPKAKCLQEPACAPKTPPPPPPPPVTPAPPPLPPPPPQPVTPPPPVPPPTPSGPKWSCDGALGTCQKDYIGEDSQGTCASACKVIQGSPCDSTKWEQDISYGWPELERTDFNTFPSPLNIDTSAAGRRSLCCLWCVRDSRCNSWTLLGGSMCVTHSAGPGARQQLSGAVSGSALPRVPDIPADPQGAPSCVSAYAADTNGRLPVRKHVVGGTPNGQHKCTPCWMPEPDNARYLLAYPDDGTGGTAETNAFAKYPVYIWMPAEGQAPAKYTGALEHIASYGFVVVSAYVDYTRCHSNLCNNADFTKGGTGAIYRNNSYLPTQKFMCNAASQCVPTPNPSGSDGATCKASCGPIQPPAPPGNESCTEEQVARGEHAVAFAVNRSNLSLAIGGASATAPSVLKVSTHLADDIMQNIKAVVLQHPSYQPGHTTAMDKAFSVYSTRAAAGQRVPDVLAVSGYMCQQLGDCAPILYDKACRVAAAASPKTPADLAVLADCGDCTADAGTPVAWREFASKYAAATQNKAAVASVAGPWHHWASQNPGEVPTRQGCGTNSTPLPETAFVIAWLTYALKSGPESQKALTTLRNCQNSGISSGIDEWMMGRLSEDRLRNTPAGNILETAISQHPNAKLEVPTCSISNGRISTKVQANFTGSLS